MNWLTDPGLWAFLNFALLAWLIVKFGGKPIAGVFRQRQEEVARTVAVAENALAEAQATLDEARKFEAEEHALFDKVHAGARQLAASLAEDVAREARADAERLAAAARAEIERERHALLSSLRAELLREAFALAEGRIRDSLGPDRHRTLFEQFALQAGKVKP